MANLDIDSLLQEISPDAPCGDNLEDDMDFMSLQDKAKGTPEREVGGVIEPSQPPNWKEVRRDLLKLMEKTRDLRLLLELARASLNLDGIAGFRESLELLASSLENYWETIHPQLDPYDDYDPLQRLNILMGLCNNESTIRYFLNAPLVESSLLGRFSLRDIHVATGKYAPAKEGESVDLSAIEAVFRAAVDTDNPQLAKTILDGLLNTQATLEKCLETLDRIEAFVTEKVGTNNAPSLQILRDKLKEALYALNERMPVNGAGVTTEIIEEDASENTVDNASAQPVVLPTAKPTAQLGAINNRQDVIRALDLICEYYAKHEPSSPVPILAIRAKRLVTKTFMEIMEDLAPDGLSQIRTIKGNDPEEYN